MSTLTLMGAGPEAAGGAGPFDPSTLTGLQAWYKADAGTSTTTDGAAISAWNDQSVNAHHLAQATGTKQPLYKAAIQNGLPVVRFDGVDDFLRATFTLVQPAFVFVVAQFRAAYTVNAVVCDGVTAQNQIIRASATQYQLWAGSLGALLSTTPQAWHVIEALFNNAAPELRADGGTAVTGSVGAQNAAGVTIGTDNGGTQPATVDVGEYILLSAAPSAGDRTNTEAYLKTRWATP